MNGDISVLINNIKLNIRVGILFKYQDRLLIEVPKVNFYNSVIPGGRMKIGEYSIDALKREIKEEMNYTLEDNKIKFVKIHEEMFNYDNVDYHELFFIYKYDLDYNDYQELLKIKENQDNHGANYLFVSEDEFIKYNLLPIEIRNIFKGI